MEAREDRQASVGFGRCCGQDNLVEWENCGFEENERRGKSESSRSGLVLRLGRLELGLGQSAAGIFQSAADLFQSDPGLGGLES